MPEPENETEAPQGGTVIGIITAEASATVAEGPAPTEGEPA